MAERRLQGIQLGPSPAPPDTKKPSCVSPRRAPADSPPVSADVLSPITSPRVGSGQPLLTKKTHFDQTFSFPTVYIVGSLNLESLLLLSFAFFGVLSPNVTLFQMRFYFTDPRHEIWAERDEYTVLYTQINSFCVHLVVEASQTTIY